MEESRLALKRAVEVWQRKANFYSSIVRQCDEYEELEEIWRSHSFSISKIMELESCLEKITPWSDKIASESFTANPEKLVFVYGGSLCVQNVLEELDSEIISEENDELDTPEKDFRSSQFSSPNIFNNLKNEEDFEPPAISSSVIRHTEFSTPEKKEKKKPP